MKFLKLTVENFMALPSLRSTPVCRPISFVRFVMFSPAFYKSDIDR